LCVFFYNGLNKFSKGKTKENGGINMLDMKRVRDHFEEVVVGLQNRGVERQVVEELRDLDEKRRELILKTEQLKQYRNTVTEEISQLKRNKEDASAKIAEMKQVGEDVKATDALLAEVEEKLEYQMTQEGYDKLVEELEHYKKVKRPEVIEKIKVARSFGDLSENSEYDAAKDEQGFIEQRILEMEQMIRYAVIIELDEKSSTIRLGNKVTYQELPDGLTETYKIVGSAEANPFEYKISNESPVAQALLGKEVGDVAKVSLPTGPEDSMDIKILAVE